MLGWLGLHCGARPKLVRLRADKMIAGVHAIVFAEDAEVARSFFREVLGLASVDAGDGWLIFALPQPRWRFTQAPAGLDAGSHVLFLMCHDVEHTVAHLKSRGVEFVTAITETRFKVPGAGEMGLYQPTHASPLSDFAAG